MATVSILPVTRRQKQASIATRGGSAAVVLCATVALLLLGYHPAAEDGGIYAAATALRLQPHLFPLQRGFATAHTAHSFYVPLLALCVRALNLPLELVLALAYAASIGLTLAAAQYLLKVLHPESGAQWKALLLFSVSLGLPVAGTSLYLVDPYLTARSFSTPLLILATASLLRRRTVPFAISLAAATALHPMMAACSLPLFATLLALRSDRRLRNIGLLVSAILAVMLLVRWFGPIDSPALRAASLSRQYWFPRQWASYEVLGLLAPPTLLLWLASRTPKTYSNRPRQLAVSTATATLVTALPAFCLIHANSRSLLLARLQPLRLLHLVYCIFLLLLAARIASLQGKWLRYLQWIAVFVAGTCLFSMQRQLYSHSAHLEWPGTHPVNGYVQAFEWIRQNTPQDALFALDAGYTTAEGEDAQLFRAIALRSSLPDAAKDGGISSVVPALAKEWAFASRAQTGLASMPDSERFAKVRPLGATWIVLPAHSETRFSCPYRNEWARVCRLP